MSENGVERLRQLWTPFGGIEQLEIDDAPQTRLDSMVRDLLHRTIQQRGPFTLKLEQHQQLVLNAGVLRWEIAGIPGYREVSLWIEREDE
jgi:hypothetical protein